MEFEDFINNNNFLVNENDAKNHNVLVFAFVGDAVFTLYVRDYLATTSTFKAGVLHTETSKFVKASFQAHLIDLLNDSLTEDEKRVSNSARNSHTHNIAKNSSIEEYKKATSFESVLGYLYMTKNTKRLCELLEICKSEIEKNLK